MSILRWLNERMGSTPPQFDATSRAVSAEGMAALGLNGAGRMYLRDSAENPAAQEIVFRTDDGVARVYPLTPMQVRNWLPRFAHAVARGK